MSRSGWPKRLVITSLIVIGLSTALMISSYDEMVDILDPSQNHLLHLEEGESAEVNLSKDHSYLLFRIDDNTANCLVVENATNTEVRIEKPTLLHTDREGADAWYTAVGWFAPDESGLHIIENTNNATNQSLWIIDEYDLGDDVNSVYLFQGGCYGLLCGVCLLPIAIFVWLSSKKKGVPAGVVMQTAGGTLIPIAPSDQPTQQRVPTTDEVWRSVHGGEPLNLTIQDSGPIEPEVPAPFANRPDRIGEIARVKDEIESVDESAFTDESKDTGEEEQRSWKTWDEG